MTTEIIWSSRYGLYSWRIRRWLVGPVGQQDQLMAALAQGQKQRQQHGHDQQPVADLDARCTTAPATARSTNPIAIVSTSMMTMCFSGPE